MNRTTTVVSMLVAAASLAAVPTVCLAHDGAPVGPGGPLHYGQTATLGTGTVRTYVLLGSEKDPATNRKPPVELGVEIPWNVMYGLPDQDAVALMDFPIQARDTAIQYMILDWNAHGHEPVGIYDVPHFDFHFYIQDADDVAAIAPGPCSGLACDDFQRAMKPVPAQFLPQGYINVGSVVPYMGNHLIDPTSPEFNGKPFTRTWLYGAYDGQITFLEPMITYESLLQKEEQCTTLKLPQQYAATGYYPRKYCTRYDTETGVYKVLITDFVYRVAPAQPAAANGSN